MELSRVDYGYLIQIILIELVHFMRRKGVDFRKRMIKTHLPTVYHYDHRVVIEQMPTEKTHGF